MSKPHYCPYCRAPLPAPRSRTLGILVVSAAWIVSMGWVFAAMMIGPLILIAGPLVFAGGLAVLTAAYAWADDEWICDACGKLIEREPTHVPTPTTSTLRPAPTT